MTGYESKRSAARDKLNNDDNIQVYKDDGNALLIAYQSGYFDAKKKYKLERNFCERCGKRLGAADHIHTCTPPQETIIEKI